MVERFTKRQRRYTARRKREIVMAFRQGRITFEEISLIHAVSREEFNLWCSYYDQGGFEALRLTRVQDIRSILFEEKAA